MIILKDVGEFNRTIAKKGFSKRSFARKSGLNESTFIRISNGKQSPRPQNAKKIIETLGLEFEDVFCFKDSEKRRGNHDSSSKCSS